MENYEIECELKLNVNALEISIEFEWIVYNESFIDCFDIELQFGLSFCIALGMTV